MKYMKPLCIALTAIGLSAPALAQSPLCIPSQNGGFQASADTLYFRENNIHSMVDNSNNFGGNLQLGYLIPQTGNDLTFHYTFLNNNDTGSIVNDANRVSFNGKQGSSLDIFDLEGGQRLVNAAFDLRLFAGVRYADVAHQLGLDTVSEKGSANQSFDTTFKGIGPRFGADIRYNLTNGFGLDSHLHTTLLVGNVKSTYQDASMTYCRKMDRVIPEAAAKIGFDYTQPINPRSSVKFELGYSANNYFNVIDGSPLNQSGDASFHGPYLDIIYTP